MSTKIIVDATKATLRLSVGRCRTRGWVNEMKVASHCEKVERLAGLRRRLDPLDDFELWYWATLTAGTNMLNAVLHRAGLTRDDPVFSTIPGVHWVRQADGGYARELRGPGDVSHVGWPPVEGDKPGHLVCLEHALERIEQHRDPCVRGDRQPTQAIVDECEQAFCEAYAILSDAIGQSRGAT